MGPRKLPAIRYVRSVWIIILRYLFIFRGLFRNLVQLWTVGNYHWYLKQEMRVQRSSKATPTGNLVGITWDPIKPLRLHLLTTGEVRCSGGPPTVCLSVMWLLCHERILLLLVCFKKHTGTSGLPECTIIIIIHVVILVLTTSGVYLRTLWTLLKY